MIQFPSTAYVGRILPKDAFFKQMTLSSELREKFVTDVRRIRVEYSLTASSINVDPTEDLTEILVLSIQLKRQDYDKRIVETIARQNAHRIVFIITHEEQMQFALYYTKLHITDWQPTAIVSLEARGRNLPSIWEGFIEQIALANEAEPAATMSVEDRIYRQEQIAKLQKEIDKLERMKRKEIQPKKRFALHQQLQNVKRKLEELL